VLDHPELVTWSSRLFDPVASSFPGAQLANPTFTYPQFENVGDETQAFDSAGRLHVVTSRVPDEDITGDCVGDFYPERAVNATPYHHWRDTAGTWHTLELPFRSGSSGRTKLAFDGADNAYVVLPDARIVAASAASEWTDWELVFAADDVEAVSELVLDRRRLSEDGVLTVAYQEPPADVPLCRGSTSSPACVSAFRLASFALGSDAPDAPKATEPEDPPAAAAGSSDLPAPDLELGIAASASFVRGRSGAYDVSIRNAGTARATGAITVRAVLPEGLTFAGGTSAGWSCQANGPDVECVSDADVDAGAAAPLRIDVTVAQSAAGSVTAAATVTAPDDHRPANNVAGTETAVGDPQADQPPGSPPPSVGGDAPPSPRAASLQLRTLPKRPPLSRLLRGGLPVSGRCAGGTSGTVTLAVTRKQARRARLPKRTLATAALRCRTGTFTARLRAKGRVRRMLARLDRALPATVVAELGQARDRTRITLR
jgi:uncharacterized repeat protein (TIGR01451 family)